MFEHTSPISGVAAFGGRLVATAGYDNQLILWDHKSQHSLASFRHDHLINSCAFSASGEHLVTASSDYTAAILKVPELKLVSRLIGHADDVEMAAFDPTGQRVATASRDHSVKIWSLNGRLLATCLGHQSDVISVSWSPNGQILVSTGDDGSQFEWNSVTGIAIRWWERGAVETDTVVMTGDGFFIAGDDEGVITINFGDRAEKTCAHKSGIKRLVWNENHGQLLSLSYDRKCIFWSLSKNQELEIENSFNIPPEVWPRSADFVSKNEVVFGTFSSKYFSLNLETGKWSTRGAHQTRGINAVLGLRKGDVATVGDSGALCINGKPKTQMGSLCNFLCEVSGRIFTGGQLGILFDGNSGSHIYQHRSPLNCATAWGSSSGQNFLLVGAYTGELLLFQVTETDVKFLREIKLFKNAVKGISQDGFSGFGVDATGEAIGFNLESLKYDHPKVWVYNEKHSKIANACCALKTGEFASVSRDRLLRIWSTQALLKQISTPFRNSIKTLAHLNGTICAGTYGGEISMLSLKSDTWTSVFRPTKSGISNVVAAGNRFLASSYDGNVYVV